jgi:peptide deformylase
MAVRNLRMDPDPILRKKSREVEIVDQRIICLLDDMYETMKLEKGVGLAAPQVGVLRRVIVIDVGDGPVELINPEIIEAEGSQVGLEGCLSVYDRTGTVERPQWVKVKGLNREGRMIEVEGEGMMARALCHEIDHLDGIIFTDRIIDDGAGDSD